MEEEEKKSQIQGKLLSGKNSDKSESAIKGSALISNVERQKLDEQVPIEEIALTVKFSKPMIAANDRTDD